MATIYNLAAFAAQNARPERNSDTEANPGTTEVPTAEILIFTGVRYERWTEADDAASSQMDCAQSL
jgi:hypothetical protein